MCFVVIEPGSTHTETLCSAPPRAKTTSLEMRGSSLPARTALLPLLILSRKKAAHSKAPGGSAIVKDWKTLGARKKREPARQGGAGVLGAEPQRNAGCAPQGFSHRSPTHSSVLWIALHTVGDRVHSEKGIRHPTCCLESPK